MNKEEKDKENVFILFISLLGSVKFMIFFFVVLIVAIFYLSANKQLATVNLKSVDAYSKIDSMYDGQLVAVFGKFTITEAIADSLINADNFVSIGRKIEQFAWHENETYTENSDGAIGFNSIDTFYYYYKQWTDSPPNSAIFNQAEKHVNPTAEYNTDVQIADIKIGLYNLNAGSLDLFSDSKWIDPANYMDKPTSDNALNDDFYFFKGKGTYDNPIIGDIRYSYWADELPEEVATVVGKLDLYNKRIIPYLHKKNSYIYDVLYVNKQLVYKLESGLGLASHIIGFIVLWISLYMIISPISIAYNIVPILKNGFVNDIIECGILALAILILILYLRS